MEAGLIEEFMVFYFDANDSSWKPVDGVVVDTVNSTVTAYTSHFTPFVLTAIPSATGTVADPPSCITQDFPGGIGGSGNAVFTIVDENFKYYQDRDYFIKPLSQSPENATVFADLGLEGALGISTINGNSPLGPFSAHKLYTGDDYILFTAHTDIDVYVMYDTRGGVDRDDTFFDAPWLAAAGFTDTGYFLETTDAVTFYTVYKKTYLQGELVQLHGNRKGVTDGGINTNYWVIVKKQGDTTNGSASDLCVAEPDFTPPANVTNLNALPGADTVILTWQNPDDPDFAGVVIRRSDISPPMNIGDGDEPTGIVLSPQSYRDTALLVNTTYYYTIFSLDQNNNFLIGQSITVKTSSDSDGDGLSDKYEDSILYFTIKKTGMKSDRLNPDTDGDGINDGDEVSAGTDPTNPDNNKPVITDFTLTSLSPTIDPVATFNLAASDDTGIFRWLITGSSDKPLSTNVKFSAIQPSSINITSDTGIKNFYIWAKDAAGNVSDQFLPLTIDFTLTFNNIYNNSTGHSIITTIDGGYAMAGIDFLGSPNKNIIITKLDVFGNIQWSKTFNNLIDQSVDSIKQTIDNGYTIISHGIKGNNYRVINIDPSGNLISSNSRSLIEIEDINTIVQTSDGGYYVAGQVRIPKQNPSTKSRSIQVYKIDSSFNTEWFQIFSFGDFEAIAYDIKQTSDNGFIMSGTKVSWDKLGKVLNPIWVVKASSTGVKEWDYFTGGSQIKNNGAYSISLASDGGFYVAGEYRPSAFVLKLNSVGIEEWIQVFDINHPSATIRGTAFKVIETSDNNCIITVAYNNSVNLTFDYFLMKLFNTGSVLWTSSFDRTMDIPYSLTETNDNGFILTGESITDDGAGGFIRDNWVIKTDSQGNVNGL